jgi:hypothetical protein
VGLPFIGCSYANQAILVAKVLSVRLQPLTPLEMITTFIRLSRVRHASGIALFPYRRLFAVKKGLLSAKNTPIAILFSKSFSHLRWSDQ